MPETTQPLAPETIACWRADAEAFLTVRDQASPAPWEVVGGKHEAFVKSPDDGLIRGYDGEMYLTDAIFIAAARADPAARRLLAALAEVERLRWANSRLEADLKFQAPERNAIGEALDLLTRKEGDAAAVAWGRERRRQIEALKAEVVRLRDEAQRLEADLRHTHEYGGGGD